MIETADLSHWQSGPSGGPIDFAAMKAGGISAIMLKATQGSSWIDPTFVSRVVAAQAAGLLVGCYHFSDASSPIAQASHFLTIAGSIPKLALDIEPNGMGDTVSVVQAAEIVARIQSATGKLPMVYISRWGPTGTGAGLPNSILARCDLWLPSYSSNPVCPDGWDTWRVWQHTNAGTVPGVSGPCDRNYFSGTVEELATWWSL